MVVQREEKRVRVSRVINIHLSAHLISFILNDASRYCFPGKKGIPGRWAFVRLFRISRCRPCFHGRSIRDDNERRDENHSSPNSTGRFYGQKISPTREWPADRLWPSSELETPDRPGSWTTIYHRRCPFATSRITPDYISSAISRRDFYVYINISERYFYNNHWIFMKLT